MSNCCAPKTPFVPRQVLEAVDQIEKLCAKRAKNSEDTPSLQPDTNFGLVMEMSTDGNLLVIGAPGYDAENGEGVEQENSGAVFVFRRKESFAACENTKKRDNKYKLQQILVATDPKTGANQVQANTVFGSSLSVSGTGSRIAVGAVFENNNDGAVYIFDQKSKSLLYGAVQRIEGAKQSDSGSLFGFETALSNDGRVLFVSQNVSVLLAQTRVFIYENCGFDFSTDCFRQSKKNKGFGLKQIVTVEQIVQGTNISVENVLSFGSQTKLSENGNTALISAPTSVVVNETGDTVSTAGLVFVVQRFANHKCSTGVTQWSTTQVLTSKKPQEFAQFGRSLALTPDARFAVVEEPGRDKEDPEREDVGLVSVFERSHKDCAYKLEAELCPTGDNTLDSPSLKNSVAVSDDGCTIAVGYEETSVSQVIGAGAVVTYQRRCGSSEWKQTQVLTAFPFVEQGQTFGSGLAMSGDGNSLAVGAWIGNLIDFVYTFSSRFASKH